MIDETPYDLAIIGGGLAGLSLSIQLARLGHRVILFEKEKYPFHKVCGEYISNESRDFLEGLGIDLKALNASSISRLQLSAAGGNLLQQELPLGGFGISRYRLDHELSKLAAASGVRLMEATRVNEVQFTADTFQLVSSNGNFSAKLVTACFGKRSNLDIKWRRPFAMAKKNKLNNYIGVKYHLRCDIPVDTIALHNFKGGYCGIVKIEADQYNLCYLGTAAGLQQYGDIKKMEQQLLSRNPHLKKIFANSELISEEPVVISQVSFDKKKQVEDHVLMIGDAAGMITPLCGNGMSMALHGSKIAAEQAHLFLQGVIGRKKMEEQYVLQWRQLFAARLRTGRLIQRIFTGGWTAGLLIRLVKPFPGIVRWLISKTHGKPF